MHMTKRTFKNGATKQCTIYEPSKLFNDQLPLSTTSVTEYFGHFDLSFPSQCGYIFILIFFV